MTNWEVPDRLTCFYMDNLTYKGVYVIYAFMDKYFINRKVVYVGMAKNICNRLGNHNIISMLKNNGILVTAKVKECDNPRKLEYDLIKKLKPIFNIKSNNKYNNSSFFNAEIEKMKEEISKNSLSIISG